MNKPRKRTVFRWITILVVMFAVAAAGGSFWLYRQNVSKAVYATTVSFMQQIADHDRLNVVNQMNNKWEYIDNLVERLRRKRESSMEEVILGLGVETQTTAFNRLYLVTDEDMVYSNTYLEQTLDRMSWAQGFRDSSDRFVMRYREDGREEWGEYLIYGIHPELPVECGDKTVVGVVGVVSISQITEQMRLESFDGNGLAFVMQPSGDIVTAVQNYPGVDNNYFVTLENSDFTDDGSLKACKEAIAGNKKMFTEISNSDGQFYVLFQPIGYGEKGDWYLVLQVGKNVISSQVNSIIYRSLPFFLILGIILIAVTYFFYRNINAVKAAQAAEHAKSAFLANMSHEIRTPLNGIVGLQYLMRQNLNNPEKLEVYLKKSELSADFLKGVITDVLDMSKIESGQLELFQSETDLIKLLEEVRAVLGTQAEERGQTFRVDYEKVTHPFIICDSVRVKQILTNLLGNSLKFTPAGGEIGLEVSQSAENGTAVTTFVVCDNGCGMSPDFVKRIWQPFEQERRVASINGTGLGTTLSKTLADKMGGSIGVESRPNEGTKFTVVIPFAIAENPCVSESGEEAPDWELKGKRVLIAEDNQINLMILSAILSDRGCLITEVTDGEQAVEEFKNNPPDSFDLILMDVQMPVMDGYEATRVIRTLRSDGATVPIIATTANAFRADVEKALESGMNDVVTKPIDVALLLEKIKNIQKNG